MGNFKHTGVENKVMNPHIPYIPKKTITSVCPILFLFITPLNAIILKKILCIVLFKYVSLKDKDSLKKYSPYHYLTLKMVVP